jgi:hypothetical protein
VSTPRPRPPSSSRSARSAIRLHLLLHEIERSGSGSAVFWRMFWDAEPFLSDTDLERLLCAIGMRGDPYYAAVAMRDRLRR